MHRLLPLFSIIVSLAWLASGVAAQEVDIPEVELDTETHRSVELVVVYLGAADCGPCRTEETKLAVRGIIDRVRAVAAERDLPFHSVGAALAEDWREGVAFLESTAEFDEVMAGGSWFNQAAVGVGRKNELVRLVSGPRVRAWLDAGAEVFEP